MKLYGSALSDAEWAILEPLIPPAKPGGRPRSVKPLVKGLCVWQCMR